MNAFTTFIKFLGAAASAYLLFGDLVKEAFRGKPEDGKEDPSGAASCIPAAKLLAKPLTSNDLWGNDGVTHPNSGDSERGVL
jgi:hypothetical protein